MPPKKVPAETKKSAPARKRSEPIDIPRQAKAPSGVSKANEVSPKRAAKPRARKPKADEELARKINELIQSHFSK